MPPFLWFTHLASVTWKNITANENACYHGEFLPSFSAYHKRTSWFSLMSCVVGVCSKGCALISRRERMTFGVRCWWSACAALHLPHLLAARQLFALSVQNELSLSLALARSRECCFAKGGRLSCTRRPQNAWTSIGFGSLDNWNAGSAIIILLKSMIIISLGCINQPSDWLTYQPTTPSPYIQQALLLVCDCTCLHQHRKLAIIGKSRCIQSTRTPRKTSRRWC